MNTYNGMTLNCFNTLITDKEEFEKLFKVAVSEDQAELPFVYVHPKVWYYGTEGAQLSCMDCRFYEWNKELLSLGLTIDQMKKLNDISNTRLNFSHRAGHRSGSKHAKSMAILYPKG